MSDLVLNVESIEEPNSDNNDEDDKILENKKEPDFVSIEVIKSIVEKAKRKKKFKNEIGHPTEVMRMEYIIEELEKMNSEHIIRENRGYHEYLTRSYYDVYWTAAAEGFPV